jgi:hypothetical protein
MSPSFKGVLTAVRPDSAIAICISIKAFTQLRDKGTQDLSLL